MAFDPKAYLKKMKAPKPSSTSEEVLDNMSNAMYLTESNDQQFDKAGNPLTSSAGAIGAAQVMPTTAPEAAKLAGLEYDEQRYKNDKEYNKTLGKAYLKNQAEKFDGDPEKAFAAYNAGPSRVQKLINTYGENWKDHLPEETKDYIQKNMKKMDVSRSPSTTSKKPFDPKAYLQKNRKPEETSDLYDAVKSVGQGITLGGGDEVVAAVQSFGDYVKDPKVKSWLETWRKHQQENEAEYDKVKERSPIISTVGEIAGGLAPALYTGGATAGMSLGGRLAAAGGLGTVAGALSSDDEFGTKENLADAGMGTGIGLLGEGVASAVKPVSKAILNSSPVKAIGNSIDNLVNEYPIVRQHLKSFGRGAEGKAFFGETARENLVNESGKAVDDLTGSLNKMRGTAAEEYGKVFKSAPEISGFNSDQLKAFNTAESILDASSKRLGYADEQISSTFNKIKSGEPINAQELKDFQTHLRDNAYKINQGETYSQLKNAADAANDVLKEKVPGYTQVNSLFRDVEDSIEGFVSNISKAKDTGATTEGGKKIFSEGRLQGDTKTEGKPLVQAAKNVIEKSERPFMGGQKEFEQLLQLKKGLKSLQETNPEMLEKMGIKNIDEFFSKIRNDSDIQSIMKTISGTGSLSQTGEILGTGLRATYGAANAAGLTAGKLYRAPPAMLNGVSKALSNNSATKHLGTALQAVADQPGASRNAILFSIMQHPEARKITDGIMGVEQDEQK